MREALLVIDMLNDFTRDGAPLQVPGNKKIIPAIRREIDRARESKKTPVIYICDSHAPDDKEFAKFGWPPHAVKGTEGAEVIPELAPQKSDIVIEKAHYSGFFHTKLQEVLDVFGVDALRLTGCLTRVCVLFTAYEAVSLDYDVTVVEDAVADVSAEDHEAALRIMKEVLKVKVA